ncbi:MAG: hypothetical protein PHU27_12475 [Salinivirgaceae bacterium]|nr:hypothetical protein [Salinivirgaceae bacterium]
MPLVVLTQHPTISNPEAGSIPTKQGFEVEPRCGSGLHHDVHKTMGCTHGYSDSTTLWLENESRNGLKTLTYIQ